ncbi:MAG: hypothetical protein QM739_04015 [Propionivibrio sp.]
MNGNDMPVFVTILEMPEAVLPEATLRGVEVDALMAVAVDPDIRDARDVFHEPPRRIGFENDPLKLGDHLQSVAGRFATLGTAEIRARRTTNHTIETTGQRAEFADVAAVYHIRTAHNNEALALEATTKQVDAGEQRENQL